MKVLRYVFIAFIILYGILIFAIWSNVCVYAEQQQLSSGPATAAGNDSSPITKSISAQLKAKMCDPSNPDLKAVNTTEARICGIPKTIKSPLSSSGTPPTSSVSSASSLSSSPASVANAPPPKQHQIAIRNSTNASSLTTSLNPSSSSLPAGLAPQLKAANQQQQQKQKQPATGQNHTLAANSLEPRSGKLLNPGSHNSTVSLSHDNSSPKNKNKDKVNSDSKPRTPDSTTSGDKESNSKEKVGSSPTKSSSRTNHGSSESIESYIKNHIGSIAKDSIRHNERTR